MRQRLLPRHLVGVCLLIGGGYCSSAAALDEPFRRLSAEEIQREIVGKAVTDEAHWRDVFLANGVVQMLEDGEVILARWALDHDELCFTFPFRGRTASECFEIWRSKDLIDYRRDGMPIVEGVLRESE